MINFNSTAITKTCTLTAKKQILKKSSTIASYSIKYSEIYPLVYNVETEKSSTDM